MAQSSGTPSYVPNYFAAQPGAQSAAYANAIRSYAPNAFAGSTPIGPALAPHLSQAPNLNPDVLAAYRDMRTQLAGTSYAPPDVDQLWRQSPNARIFRPEYGHNPLIMMQAEYLRRGREQGDDLLPGGYAQRSDTQ